MTCSKCSLVHRPCVVQPDSDKCKRCEEQGLVCDQVGFEAVQHAVFGGVRRDAKSGQLWMFNTGGIQKCNECGGTKVKSRGRGGHLAKNTTGLPWYVSGSTLVCSLACLKKSQRAPLRKQKAAEGEKPKAGKPKAGVSSRPQAAEGKKQPKAGVLSRSQFQQGVTHEQVGMTEAIAFCLSRFYERTGIEDRRDVKDLDQSAALVPYTRTLRKTGFTAHKSKTIYEIIHDERTEPVTDQEQMSAILTGFIELLQKRNYFRDSYVDGSVYVQELQASSMQDFFASYATEADGLWRYVPIPVQYVHSRLGLLQDLMTEEVEKHDSLQHPGDPDPVWYYGTSYQPLAETKKNRWLISIARTTKARVSYAEVTRLHLENQIVRNDYFAARRAAEAADPALFKVPTYGQYTSLVFDGSPEYAIPTVWTPNLSHDQVRLINLFGQADAAGAEVMLLIRGMSGHSVAPQTYHQVLNAFPRMTLRIAYALRPQFVAMANIALPPAQQPFAVTPFLLHLAPLTARNFFHTRVFNVQDLVDHENGVIQNPVMQQILRWHNEEYQSRTGAGPLLWFILQLIQNNRGVGRNDVT